MSSRRGEFIASSFYSASFPTSRPFLLLMNSKKWHPCPSQAPQLASYQKAAHPALRPSTQPQSASSQELGPNFLALFPLKKFFPEKYVFSLPNDIPKLSGSPRSNPPAGKLSKAAILKQHQACGLRLSQPRLPRLLHGNLKEGPKVRACPGAHVRGQRPSASFPILLLPAWPLVPSQRWGLPSREQLNF